jgi:hypothetical protein
MHFDTPTREIVDQISALLQDLHCAIPNDHWVGRMDSIHCDGSLTAVAGELFSVLCDDYRSNLADDELTWMFDYVVVNADRPWCDDPQCGLAVLTRYHGEPEEGNIFYGRWILRVDLDRYLMWAE